MPDRDYYNPAKMAAGASRTTVVPRPSAWCTTPRNPHWPAKTLEEIAAAWELTPVETYMRIVRRPAPRSGPAAQPMEEIIATSMSEDDVRWFIAQPADHVLQ